MISIAEVHEIFLRADNYSDYFEKLRRTPILDQSQAQKAAQLLKSMHYHLNISRESVQELISASDIKNVGVKEKAVCQKTLEEVNRLMIQLETFIARINVLC